MGMGDYTTGSQKGAITKGGKKAINRWGRDKEKIGRLSGAVQWAVSTARAGIKEEPVYSWEKETRKRELAYLEDAQALADFLSAIACGDDEEVEVDHDVN